MTVKEFLGQAYLLDKRIKRNIDRKEMLDARMQSIASPGFGEHCNPNRSTDAPYVKILEQIMEFEEIIANETAVLIELQKQIWQLISTLEKPEERMILQLRYLDNYTWPCIADELVMDKVTVHRWHNKALAKLSLPENAINLKLQLFATECNY